MYFIHKICWFEWFMHKTFSVFQKFQNSRFSIDRMCFLTDQKCDKNFGLSLPSSIDAWSIESIFWLIEAQFRLVKIRKLSFIKSFSSRVLHYFKNFFKLFLTFSLWPIQSKDFCCFLSQISPRFLSSSIGKSFIPFLFQLNHMFHAFSYFFFFWKNSNIAI